jgi:hypothetical protein
MCEKMRKLNTVTDQKWILRAMRSVAHKTAGRTIVLYAVVRWSIVSNSRTSGLRDAQSQGDAAGIEQKGTQARRNRGPQPGAARLIFKAVQFYPI